jgi:hypothetical protein
MMMIWVEHIAHMGKIRNVYKILVGKPEGSRKLRRLRHTWEGNIKMVFIEIGCGLDSSGSGHGPVDLL